MRKLILAAMGSLATGLGWLAAKATSFEPRLRYERIESPWRTGKPSLRLVHVTDFHGGSGIWSAEALNRQIRQAKPDLVCVTGDHFDPKYPIREVERALTDLAQELPVLFVSGNNDEEIPQVDELMHRLRVAGVRVLENEAVAFFMKEGGVTVLGIRDHKAYPGKDNWLATVQENLHKEELREPRGLRIVLAHRPEITTLYDSLRQDLVLCGHAHGGQWRLPGGRGVFAPNQGLFPKYSRGIYERGKDQPYRMLVSSGFDVHPFVPRIFNRPELVVLDVVGES